MEKTNQISEVKFGATLKAMRKTVGISQGVLSEKTGLSVEAISNLERGQNYPSYVTLEKLSEALQTPIRDFFESNESSKERAETMTALISVARQLSDRNLINLLEVAKTLKDHAE